MTKGGQRGRQLVAHLHLHREIPGVTCLLRSSWTRLAADPGADLPPACPALPDLTRLPMGCSCAPRCPSGPTRCREACPDEYRVSPDHMARCFVLESVPTTCNGRSEMRKGGRYGAEWHTLDAGHAHLRALECAGVARHAGLAAGRCGARAWWGTPHRHDRGGYP